MLASGTAVASTSLSPTRRPDGPVIVTGGCNCGEGSAPHVALIAGQLRDTYRSLHAMCAPDKGTFHGFRGKRIGARIDWILASPDLRVEAADINRFRQHDRYPSDHFPVQAVLR